MLKRVDDLYNEQNICRFFCEFLFFRADFFVPKFLNKKTTPVNFLYFDLAVAPFAYNVSL